MPYVSDGRKLIEHAFRHGYALPAFNFCSLEMAKACVEAAEELQAPVILQTYPADLSSGSPRVMAAMVRALAEEARVPVMLHLDHGGGLGAVVECLRAGYSSVMLDGGGMALAQVLEATRRAAEVVHAAGAALEVAAERFNPGEAGATDPEAAARVREAGADLVACAVGSEHGRQSRLDLRRLEAVAGAVRGPLVLHGGSGVEPADLARAVGLGVAKVNVGSASYRALLRVWRERAGELSTHRAVYAEARAAVGEQARSYIALLGAAGKAREFSV
ncbi:Fructose-bisphosphate aldolase [Calidithermus terrae]|uniref:Fructose-bisphosphate aldolase n=1 Tax=Calidithermus terrae TaxID=1408545 RepID=A0A399ELS4_9DEIN|nr:class II fructose-bisphosphate aldolase [Calidithermus terrae]RIH85684.1 Fructose-bisphosphate aldolase [Calidithermus terrae]